MLEVVGLLVILCGIVAAVFFGPRMMGAFVLLVRDRKGIGESVSVSIRRTQGYWGKLFGNSLLFALCMIVIAFAVMFVVAIVAGIVGAAVGMLSSMLGTGVTAFLISVPQMTLSSASIFFTALLAATVLENSKQA
jgi:hypothetical protein